MTTAILAAGKWLNDGPLPTRHPWRRGAGAVVFLLGVAVMLGSGVGELCNWIASGPSIVHALEATLGLIAGFVIMMLLDPALG